MLNELQRLLAAVATESPPVVGWRARVPPCPRFNRQTNRTEVCCSLDGRRTRNEGSWEGRQVHDQRSRVGMRGNIKQRGQRGEQL
eukprot:6173007-Pleurochrysis_carterae.AAC.2